MAYFTQRGSPLSQLALLPEQALQQAGGRVVSTLEELQSAGADAVVIDPSSIEQVTSDWLTEQYNGGTVLVGLNFPANELTAKLVSGTPEGFANLSDQGHGPGQPLEGIPYATIIWHTPTDLYPDGGHLAGQSHVDLDRNSADRLINLIAERIRNAAGTIQPQPTAAE